MRKRREPRKSGRRRAVVLAFGEYTFDLQRQRLAHVGREVRVEPQVLKLLAYLIERGGQLVSREELLEQVWAGAASETTLNYAVSRARVALAAYAGPTLTTVRGKGYRFEPTLTEAREEPSEPVLIDRASELQTLRRLAAAAEKSSEVRLALITGPAGIGKTKLAQMFASEWASEHNFSLRACAMEGSPALWPWLCLLEDLKEAGVGAGPVPVDKVDGQSLGRASEADRYEYFASVRGYLQRVARRHPLLLIIEDLHLADDSTTQLLEFLSANGFSAPLLLIATCRTPVPAERERSLDALARHGRALQLGPLSEQGARRLFRSLLGTVSNADEDRALALTGGNPLFLTEAALGMRTNPEWSPHALLAGPSAVHDSVRWHLSALDATTEGVLRMAAVAGEQFDASWVASALETKTGAVLSALATAVRQGVVKAVGELDFRFTHALLRQYLLNSLTEAERRDCHWRLGSCLVRAERHHSDHGLALAAHHLAEGAVDQQQLRMAVDVCRRAAEASSRRFAFQRAASDFIRTSRFAERGGMGARTRVELLVHAADCFRFGGWSREAKDAAREAIALARSSGDALGLAEAVIAHIRSEVDWIEASVDTAQSIDEVLAMLPAGADVLRARLLAHRAESVFDGAENKLRLSSAAVELSRGADPQTRALVLAAQSRAHLGILSEKRHWPGLIERATLAARGANEPELEMILSWLLVVSILERGDLDLAQRQAASALERAQQLGNRLIPYMVQVQAGALAIFQGTQNAPALCRLAWETGRAITPRMAEHGYQGQVLALAWEAGSDSSLLTDFASSGDILATEPLFLSVLGTWLAIRGDRLSATRVFDKLAAADFPLGVSSAELATLTISAELCAYVMHREHAARLYERLLPFAGYLAVTGACYTIPGIPAYALARLAIVLDQCEAARSHLAVARDLASRFDSPRWLQRCDAASKRLDAGGPFTDWAPRATD